MPDKTLDKVVDLSMNNLLVDTPRKAGLATAVILKHTTTEGQRIWEIDCEMIDLAMDAGTERIGCLQGLSGTEGVTLEWTFEELLLPAP